MKYHFVTIALSLLNNYVSCDRVVDNFTTPTYAIIIDAGSTGTRVNLYTFHKSVVDGQLVLDDSLFLETKPGLRAFAKNPKDVKKSLNILLDEARTRIPQVQWASTPMSLRATAGLRLLPENEAQAILDECKLVYASSGFKVTEDSVAIMDGTDEGIFSWITINYLLGKLDDLNNTVAALDLGGGSNQVTFSVAPDAIPRESLQAKNIHRVSTLGKNISLCTESFLGMGLNAAREKILTHLDNPRKNGSEVTSECVSPLVSMAEWNYRGKTYVVSGPKGKTDGGSVGFDKCIGIIKEAGLIDGTGGIVTVGGLHKAASEVCENPSADSPFMCLDLSFIYALFHDGFGLDKTSNINLRKYINRHEVSWALGAAFELLKNDV